MRICYFLLAFFLFYTNTSTAQVLPPDTTIIRYAGQLTGQYTSGGVNRTLLATTHTLTLLRGQHFGAPVTGSFTYGRQDGLLKERELLFNATPYYWLGHFRAYGIGGYEQSNLRGINQRIQLGLGPGWAFYTDSLGREVSVSNLFIREATYFQDGSQRIVSRSSLRLRLVYNQGVFSLHSTTFYQPNLSGFADYRINQLSTLALRFTARFAITASYTYTYESRVLEGKPNDNTNLTVGVAFSTKQVQPPISTTALTPAFEQPSCAQPMRCGTTATHGLRSCRRG